METTNEIYICSTYYHTLMCVLRALNNQTKFDLLITCVDPNIAEEEIDKLHRRLRESGIFNNVLVENRIPRDPRNTIEKLLWRHGLYVRIVEEFLQIDFQKYKEIYVFLDSLWTAKYFKDKKMHYNVCEDGLDFLKLITPESPFWYLIQPLFPKNNLRSIFKLGGQSYEYYTRSKYVKRIEVNDKHGIVLPEDERIVEVPQKELFKCINETNLNKILNIYLEEPDIFREHRIVLILTIPLYQSGFVNSQEEQLKVYKDLVDQYKDYNVIIKPHPRDNTDYSTITAATTINRYFPSELIPYIDHGHIEKYVTILSTSVMGYPKEKAIFYPSVDAFYKSKEKGQK